MPTKHSPNVRAILAVLWIAFAAASIGKAAPVGANTSIASPQQTDQPHTLAELLALSRAELEKLDLARMNLLCAEGLRGADTLDVTFYLNTLDSWAHHVESETRRNFHRFAENPKEYNESLPYYRMLMLVTVLQQDFAAFYTPERALPQLRGEREPNDVFFADSRDVFLHGLLTDKHQGTCSSLPVLYVAVAQRLGYPVSLAAAKGHFYVRYEQGAEHLNIDATTIGFKPEPDEFYRHWPQPVSDEEARTYGLLRPMTKPEILGAFLTIRAAVLTSMKQFDEAASAWEQAARFLPGTPVLTELVEHAQARAKNEAAANRWDQLWDQVATLEVRADSDYGYFRDRQTRLHLFMNQSTNLLAIEEALSDLRAELQAHRQHAMFLSDAPAAIRNPSLQSSRDEPQASPASPTVAAQPAVRIAAENVPPEYHQSLPEELLEQLRGVTREDDVVSEMWAFNVQQVNRRNREALAKAIPQRPESIPSNTQPDWLRDNYGNEMPSELRSRLRILANQSQIEWTAHQFREEQKARAAGEQLRQQNSSQIQLTGPPVRIEIVPTEIGAP
jgi:hypothetical protein